MAQDSTVQLDVAFACDCTASMGSYIHQAQRSIQQISADIRAKCKASLRFALVEYRDHPPQDSTFVTRINAFTDSLQTMQQYVDQMSAQGGGDGPEAVADALHEIANLPWRDNAIKICVWIADAPPHGLGEASDGFPNGTSIDPLQAINELKQKGVVTYAVGCEPALSTSYKHARDFMMNAADSTEGKYLPLGKADLLSKVVVGGALEGVSLEAIWAEVKDDLEGLKKQGLSTEEACAKHHAKVAAVHVADHVEVDSPYAAGYDYANVKQMQACSSLSALRAQGGLSTSINSQAPMQAQQYNYQAQQCQQYSAPPSVSQLNRWANHHSGVGH